MQPQELHRLSAVMFTDMVGYSKSMSQDEAGTMAFLRIHNTVIRDQVAGYAGKIIKSTGDGFMITFESAIHAVSCASEIQKALAPERDRHIRIGIHIGDTVVAENDVHGHGVNIAARIEPLCAPGAICVTKDVYHQIKSKIDFPFKFLGPKSLKNIPESVEIYVLFPTPESQSLAELAQGHAKKKVRMALAAVAVAILLATGGAYSWLQWRENLNWKLVYDLDFSNTDAVQKKFEGFYEINKVAPGGMLLQNYRYIHSLESQKAQSCRIRVKFLEIAEPAAIILSLPHSLKTIGGADGAYGPYGFIYIGPFPQKTEFILGRLDGVARAGFGTEFLHGEATRPLRKGPHWLEFSLDRDIMSIKGPNGISGASLYRDLSGLDRSKTKILMFGRHVTVLRLQFFIKDSAEEENLFDAANRYISQGRIRLAMTLLDDLLKKTKDPIQACRILYRKAMACTQAGYLTEAQEVYEHLIRDYPDNDFTGYARIDLSLLFMQRAEKLASRQGSLVEIKRLGTSADAIFNELVVKQPKHPEVWRAWQCMLRNQYLNSGDEPKALALGVALAANPRFPLLKQSLNDLNQDFITSRGNLHDRLRNFGNRFFPKILEMDEPDHSVRVYGLESWLPFLLDSREDSTIPELFSKFWLELSFGSQEPKDVTALYGLQAGPAGIRAIKLILDKIEKKPEEAFRFYRPAFAYDMWRGSYVDNRAFDFSKGYYHLQPAKSAIATQRSNSTRKPEAYVSDVPRDQSISLNSKGEQKWNFDAGTGTTWGCGAAFGLNGNFEGQGRLEFDARGPKGLIFNAHLEEDDANSKSNESPIGPPGADGEEYCLGLPDPRQFCTGTWKHYTINMAGAIAFGSRGNQDGNRTLDLQSLKNLRLHIYGGQGKGVLHLKNIIFNP